MCFLLLYVITHTTVLAGLSQALFNTIPIQKQNRDCIEPNEFPWFERDPGDESPGPMCFKCNFKPISYSLRPVQLPTFPSIS